MTVRLAASVLFIAACLAHSASAQDPLANAKPVPRMQVLPLPYDQASVTDNGRELTRYHFGPGLRRPFLYPIIGPSGVSLTRMGHPRDPNGHSHHNSVWISHNDVNGVVFWGDRGKGQIVHRRVQKYDDRDDAAVIEVHNDWVDTETGRVLLKELRAMTFTPLARGEWFLTLDLEYSADKSPATFGKTPFGLVAVRMAKTIGVHDGGGTIRNSEGGVDEKQVFWKQAQWVDYSGRITNEKAEGITLMDHPKNPNHPSHFHVRNDGWMGAALTFDAPRTVEPGQPLKLRYGLYIHSGAPPIEKLQAQYDAFAKP